MKVPCRCYLWWRQATCWNRLQMMWCALHWNTCRVRPLQTWARRSGKCHPTCKQSSLRQSVLHALCHGPQTPVLVPCLIPLLYSLASAFPWAQLWELAISEVSCIFIPLTCICHLTTRPLLFRFSVVSFQVRDQILTRLVSKIVACSWGFSSRCYWQSP